MTSPTTPVTRPCALLAAAESRAARPLRRWSADALARFGQAVAGALADDAQRWGADDALAAASIRGGARAVHAEDVEPSARPADWTALPGHGTWWHLGDSPLRRIGRALFADAGGALDGPRVADDLAAELWAGQLRALTALVARADAPADADTPAKAWGRWSGAVLVALPWAGATLQLLFRAAQVERVLAPGAGAEPASRPAGGPVVPALRALADHGTRLAVRLDPFEIDLGSLVSLSVGDVLHVRHALDKPVQVCAHEAPVDDEPLCVGWLGRRDDALAVELARPARPSAAADPFRAKPLS